MSLPAFDPHSAMPPPSTARERRRVLLALSSRRLPPQALELGRLIAKALHATLHGVFAWPTPIEASEVPRLLRVEPGELEGMVLDVEVGDPAERVAAVAAAHPTAFVILPVEPSGPDVCNLGDLAARTLAAQTAGVIVVRPSAPPPHLERILIPLDGTPSTAAGLGPAGELAHELGASLDIVLIGHHLLPLEPGAMTPPQYVDQPQHEWSAFSEEFLQRFLGSIGHCPPDVPTRLLIGRGDPAQEILHFAEELDTGLIVLVWHGECDSKHGLVFRDLMRGSDRPVLVMRR